MFKKILVANRGEIAVRVIRACRDMGIGTIAVYTESDRDSLHVRLADECLPLHSELRYGDIKEILELALAYGADAIHPGYGFLAERPEFAQACADVGVTFIGPPADVIAALQVKINSMDTAASAGFYVPDHSESSCTPYDEEALQAAAEDLGFPVVVKACRGGRGRGSRVVYKPEKLLKTVAQASREAAMIYGDSRLYLERAIAPSHYVAVQILADNEGNMVHLGEREGSLLLHNQKLFSESPAPCLSQEQRERLWQAALEIARLFDYRNAGAVEFLVDGQGRFYFTEIKARIQIEHPVSEMVSGVDIVREQIRIAAGQPLGYGQEDIHLHGWAMQARINAEDPWNNYLPSPGTLERFRLPGGPMVRVDTYGCGGCRVPVRYDPLLANLVVGGETRAECVARLRRALEDFKVVGVQTNLPLHLKVVNDPKFIAGQMDTSFLQRMKLEIGSESAGMRRDLAVAAAVAFVLRNQRSRATTPTRVQSGWHRASRHLPG